ncbi:hypothetical protein [Streptacidiphilus sp. PAMC 29251]
MTAPVLTGAAERAVEVLVAELGDTDVFGALADADEDGRDGDDPVYDVTTSYTGSKVTITMAPRGA